MAFICSTVVLIYFNRRIDMKIFKEVFCYIVYTSIWLLLLLWFWIGLPADGAMSYSIISFYLVLPISSLVISYMLGIQKIWIKWVSPIFFGCMAMMLSFLTFDLANTLSFHNQHVPDFKMALVSSIPSLIGLSISTGITTIKRRRYYVKHH